MIEQLIPSQSAEVPVDPGSIVGHLVTLGTPHLGVWGAKGLVETYDSEQKCLPDSTTRAYKNALGLPETPDQVALFVNKKGTNLWQPYDKSPNTPDPYACNLPGAYTNWWN